MQSDKMKVSFSDLTPDQAIRLTMLYAELTGAKIGDFSSIDASVEPQQPVAVTPQPAPQTQAQPTGSFQSDVQRTAAELHQVETGGTGELDKFNVPYNPDLHSRRGGTSDGKNKDGSWKCKKNGDRQAYEQWAAHHRQQAAAPAPQQHQPAQVATAPAPAPGQAFGAPPAQQHQPAPAPFGAAPQPQVQAISVEDFQNKCTQLANLGLLGAENTAWIKQQIGENDEVKIQESAELRTAAFAKMQDILQHHGQAA